MARRRRINRSAKRGKRPLVCERLEPRHLMATELLDDGFAALDQIAFSQDDSSLADVPAADFSPAPGSLDAFLASQDTSAAFDASLSPEDSSADALPAPRHNSVNRFDVDISGTLTPRDALLVIDHLNHGDPSLTQPGDDSAPGVFATDVNGDGQITAADADEVLSALGQTASPSPITTSFFAASAFVADALGGEGESQPADGGALPQNALPPPAIPGADDTLNYMTQAEVENLLARAAGATSTEDAIIAIVDRGGRILGVRMEDGVLANIPDTPTRVFAIDGAVAKARTAAFFASTQAPLTSRTIRSLSQTTITQREVESNPSVVDPTNPANDPFVDANPISRTFGPGYVAPIGVGGHFPQDIAHTPPVDLFNIESQSRDGLTHPGADGIKGTADDVALSNRFNVPTANLPQGDIPAPESYGVQSGLMMNAQGRGISTLPGGIPLFKQVRDPISGATTLTLVGGIGVFFPGLDGYATHEQGFIAGAKQTSTQRLNSAKELEAEYIAIAAAGGVPSINRTIGTISGVPRLADYTLPFGRIDLVGITLEVFGPNPTAKNRIPGIDTVIKRGKTPTTGDPNNGINMQIDSNPAHTSQDGQVVPDGWLVSAHDSPLGEITAADVTKIVNNAIAEANKTRAAIRTPAGQRTKMVIAVADKAGNILGLYRMPDATIFSIDVAVAKARNTAYYADPSALQNADKVDDDLLIAKGAVTAAQLNKLKFKNNNGVVGIPDLFTSNKSTTRYTPLTGLALTNRTFRFLAEPRYPSGVDGSLPPVFSILTDPGINRKTAENWGAPTPASKFTSVMGFDAFHASRNFRDPGDAAASPPAGVNGDPLANQNGIVYFPGSTPLYKSQILVGGFGVSGDGVDQDDVVTFGGEAGFAPPANLQADKLFYRNVRLPQQKFNRNPRG